MLGSQCIAIGVVLTLLCMVAAKLRRRCHGGHQYQLPCVAGLDLDGEHVALMCASIIGQHDSGSGAHRPDEDCLWDFYEDWRDPSGVSCMS